MRDNSQPTIKKWRTFTIAITGQAGAYVITADDSRHIRVPSQPFLWSPTPKQREVDAKLHGDGKVEPEDVAELGKALYEAVFESPNGMKTAFGWAQGDCRKNDEGLRLALRIEPHELSSLPWEAMRDASGLISARPETPLVRTFVGNELQRMDVRGSLRVLFMSATPDHQAAVNVDQTLDRLREDVLKDSLASKRLEIKVEKQVDAKSLRDHLGKRTDHVVLFAGHGEPGEIILQDGTPIVPVEFASALGYDPAVDGANNKDIPTRLVFLMACNTGASFSETDGALAGFAEELARDAGIPAVVAMQTKIGDDSADEFARKFFGAIAKFEPADVAMAKARQSIQGVGRDAIAPVMYLQAKNAALFRKVPEWERPLLAALFVVLIIVGAMAARNIYLRTVAEQAVLVEQLRADAAATNEAIANLNAESEAVRSQGYQVDANLAKATAAAEGQRANEQEQVATERQQQAERATRSSRANEMAKQAQSILTSGEDPSGSLPLLLAREAVLTTLDTDGYAVPQAEAMLREVVDAVPPYKGKLQRPSSEEILDIAFSPDGRFIATASGNAGCLFEASSGALVRCAEGHLEQVTSVAFSPDGSQLATSSKDDTVRTWNVETGEEIQRLEALTNSSDVLSVRYSPDGETIVSSSSDGTVIFWNADNGELKNRIDGIDCFVNCDLFFDLQGKTLFVGIDRNSVVRYDAQSGEELGRTPLDHGLSALSFAVSPDGQYILSGGADDEVAFLWNVVTGEKIHEFPGHRWSVGTVGFSPDGQIAATGTTGSGALVPGDNTIRLWDTLTGAYLGAISGHTGSITDLVFSPDGAMMASASYDGTVRQWEVRTRPRWVLDGSGYTISDAVLGRTQLITAHTDGAIRIWDSGSLDELHRFDGYYGKITALALSSNDELLASAGSDGSLRIWNAQKWTPNGSFPTAVGTIGSMDFSPGGTQLLTVDTDGLIQLWDVESKQLVWTMQEGESQSTASSIRFSPDGLSFVTADNDGRARLWDVGTRTEVQSFIGHTRSVTSADFSPNGDILATGSLDGTVRLWDVDTGQELSRITGHVGAVRSVDFSSDGKKLLTSGDDQTARLWDAVTGDEIDQNAANPTSLVAAKFEIPDSSSWGASAVLVREDGTARLWNTNEELGYRYFQPTQQFYAVAFVPDGSQVVTLGEYYGGNIVGGIMGGYSTKEPEIELVLWSVTAGNRKSSFALPQELLMSSSGGTSIEGAAFDSQGTTVAVLQSGEISLWNIANRTEIRRLPQATDWNFALFPRNDDSTNAYVAIPAVSPDGQWTVSATMDGMIRLAPSLVKLLEIAEGLIQRDPPVFTSEEQTRFAIEDTTQRVGDK